VSCGALFGMLLRRVLPKDHLDNESKDVVKLGMGLVATLAALVLGLLVASAKSQYYPELSANASASKTGENWMPDQEEWFLGLTLTYPFFLGGKSIMNVHAAEALMMQFEQNLKSTDAQLVLTLDQAWADYENAVEKTEVQSGFLKAQEIRAEIARSQYAAGLFSFEDWDRIENDLIGAQKDYLSGRRDAVISEANWEKVQGKSRLPEI
jgi:outer membrane protein TolC